MCVYYYYYVCIIITIITIITTINIITIITTIISTISIITVGPINIKRIALPQSGRCVHTYVYTYSCAVRGSIEVGIQGG